MMENRPPLTSPDGSSNRNTPERCPRPLYSPDSTQEHQEIPQEDQSKDLIVKVEVKEEGESYVWTDDPCKKEEIPPEISTDPGDTRDIQRDVKAEEEGSVKIEEDEIPLAISTDTRDTQRDVKAEEEEEGHVRIKEEEVPIEISTIKALQTRWRSTKDSYNSQLKKERAIRSGSAAKSFTPYVFARDLEFLKPILGMRSTDTCWDNDEPDAEEPSVSRQELPNTGSPNPERDEEAVAVEQEEGRGATAPVPNWPTTKRGGSTKQPPEKQTDKMLTFLREMSDKFAGQLSISQQFANTLVPYMDQVPSEHQLEMRIAVMQRINSYIPSAQPSAQTDRMRPMQPPPMANYAPFQNPSSYYQLSMQ